MRWERLVLGEMASGVERAESRSLTLVCFASREPAAKHGQEWWRETKGEGEGALRVEGILALCNDYGDGFP